MQVEVFLFKMLSSVNHYSMLFYMINKNQKLKEKLFVIKKKLMILKLPHLILK